MTAGVISGEEAFLVLGRTHGVICLAARADVKAVPFAAVHLDAFGMARPIRLEIRRNRMLCARAAVVPDLRQRLAPGAVLEAHRVPVTAHALSLIHDRTPVQRQD